MEGQLFIQTAEGEFIPSSIDQFYQDRFFEDVGATFFDVDNDGDQDLYVVSGSNENFMADSLMQDRIYITKGQVE